MKRKQVILFFLVYGLFLISAQDYYPFPTQNAKWYTSTSGTFCFPAPSPCNFGENIFNGDTIINSILYLKVYQLSKLQESQINEYYVGGLRESGKKVYFVQSNTQEEIVLYDFTVQIQDTVTFYSADTAVVVSIDSILIRNDYRKRFNVESIRSNEEVYFYPYSIIEGIGSINGLFAGPNMYTGFEDGWHILTCFWENGEVIYNPYGDECTELTAINSPGTLESEIGIYPNPFTNLFRIEGIEGNYAISIFDSRGELLFGKEVFADEIIDLSWLSQGLYILRIDTKEGLVQKKIVKQ